MEQGEDVDMVLLQGKASEEVLVWMSSVKTEVSETVVGV